MNIKSKFKKKLDKHHSCILKAYFKAQHVFNASLIKKFALENKIEDSVFIEDIIKSRESNLNNLYKWLGVSKDFL